MKHIEGNSPKCWECYFYTANEEQNRKRDGWCSNPYQLNHGINGKKRDKPLDRYAVNKNWCCRQWEDAEERFTHFECVTGTYRNNSIQLRLREEQNDD